MQLCQKEAKNRRKNRKQSRKKLRKKMPQKEDNKNHQISAMYLDNSNYCLADPEISPQLLTHNQSFSLLLSRKRTVS